MSSIMFLFFLCMSAWLCARCTFWLLPFLILLVPVLMWRSIFSSLAYYLFVTPDNVNSTIWAPCSCFHISGEWRKKVRTTFFCCRWSLTHSRCLCVYVCLPNVEKNDVVDGMPNVEALFFSGLCLRASAFAFTRRLQWICLFSNLNDSMHALNSR